MNNTEVISILNDLIEMCRDGQEGFRTAAATFPQQRVSALFNIFSQQQARFLTELQAEVHRFGGDTNTNASVAGEVHRGWIDLKATINRGDQARIIAECQRREEAVMNNYQEALKADLPLDVQYVVKRQYMDIKDAYDRIRILQRAA